MLGSTAAEPLSCFEGVRALVAPHTTAATWALRVRQVSCTRGKGGREEGGREDLEGGGEGGKEGAAHLVFTAGRQPGALDGRCQKYERHLHPFFLGFQPSIGYIFAEHSLQLLSGKVATWWGFEGFVGG